MCIHIYMYIYIYISVLQLVFVLFPVFLYQSVMLKSIWAALFRPCVFMSKSFGRCCFVLVFLCFSQFGRYCFVSVHV